MTNARAPWDRFTRWNDGLNSLLDGLHREDLPRKLMRLLQSLVPVDEPLMIIIIGKHQKPYIIADCKHDNQLSEKYRDYLDHLFLLDPCYRVYREKSFSGFYVFRELAPKGFCQSDMYSHFFKRHFIDEMGYIFDNGKGDFVGLCASRIDTHTFTDEEKLFYRSITPLMRRILVTHFGTLNSTVHLGNFSATMMENCMNNFCRDKLSNREHEILQLILRGYSMQDMSDELNRSINTIKRHHSTIYGKLGIASQREILPLLIQSLASGMTQR